MYTARAERIFKKSRGEIRGQTPLCLSFSGMHKNRKGKGRIYITTENERMGGVGGARKHAEQRIIVFLKEKTHTQLNTEKKK